MAHFANAEKHFEAKTELLAAKQTIDTLTEQLTAREGELTALKADLELTKAGVAAFEVKIKALETTINAPDGEIEKRAKLKALEIAAAQGVPPVGAEANPPADKPIKPDFSGLKGRDKFIAVEKWERDARKQRN